LLSGSDDTTALCWDVARVLSAMEEHSAELSADELRDLWTRLGDADAAAAYQAMNRLGRAPKQAVPFVQERLLALASSPLQAGDLRALRAVEVLELLANAEARRALKTLVEEAKGSWLGAEATAALERLATR
jgi:hypothetical protein